MANVRISDLTAVTSSVTTDELEVNQSGTSKKATLAQLLAAAGSATVTIASAATTLTIGNTSGIANINSANVGIGGVTLKTWTTYKGISFGGAGANVYGTSGDDITMAHGLYYDGSFRRANGTKAICYLSMNNGVIEMGTAASGTVDSVVTTTARFFISETTGENRIVDGLRIGADSTNNLLDDASNGAGTATLYIGNASINVTSDELVKSNIKPLDDGLSIVNALQPIEFDQDEERPWGDVRHYMGFGARASHKVAPWTVHTQGNTGLPWKMRQEFLMAPVVRAIQQLAEDIQTIKERMV